MSRFHTITIKCPYCQSDFEFRKWDSVNAAIDKAAKERILSGQFFVCTCSHCHKAHRIATPCLYHDPQQKLMIYLLPDGGSDKLEEINAIAKQFDADYRFRIVTNEDRLIEKIYIFDEQLNDRVIEMYKLLYQIFVQEENPNKEITDAYFNIGQEEKSLAFTTENKDLLLVPFDEKIYQKVAEANQSIITDSQLAFTLIDDHWARTHWN